MEDPKLQCRRKRYGEMVASNAKQKLLMLTLIFFIFLYESETWILKAHIRQKIQCVQNVMLS